SRRPDPTEPRKRAAPLRSGATSIRGQRIAASGLCLLLFISPLLAQNGDPVQTTDGAVQGLVSSAGVRVFRGIPYAAAPIGPLRWKAPQAPARRTEVRRADAFGPRCMQEPVF